MKNAEIHRLTPYSPARFFFTKGVTESKRKKVSRLDDALSLCGIEGVAGRSGHGAAPW